MTELSERQERFCIEYAKNGGNATEAYKAAGYKVKNDNVAAVSATKLLRTSKISQRMDELREQTNGPKVLSIQQRKELLTEIATDGEASKTDKIKAVDILNKMDSVYIQRQDVNMSAGVVVLHDDIPAED